MTSVTESRPPSERGRIRVGPAALALPAAAWMVAFFAAPLLVFLVYSFLTAKLYDVSGPLTLEAYRDAVTTDVNRTLAVNSLVVGLLRRCDHGRRRAPDRLLAALRCRALAGARPVPHHRHVLRELPRPDLRLALDLGRERAPELGPRAPGHPRRAARLPPLQPLLGHRRARAHLPAVRRTRPLRGLPPDLPGARRGRAGSRRQRVHALAARHPAAHRCPGGDVVHPRLRARGRRLRDAAVPRRHGRRAPRRAHPGRPDGQRELALGAALSFLMLAAFLGCYALTVLLLRTLRLDRIRFVS